MLPRYLLVVELGPLALLNYATSKMQLEFHATQQCIVSFINIARQAIGIFHQP